MTPTLFLSQLSRPENKKNVMRSPFPPEFGQTLSIGHGALGTMLRQGPRAALTVVEELNQTDPEFVRRLHAEYRTAGAGLLITNTFGANPIALSEIGRADDTAALNAAGVDLARSIAESDVPVWASIGPLDLGLRLDDYTPDLLREAYAVQARALKDADAFLLETFRDPREAEAALAAVSAFGKPVIFQIG